MKQAGNPASFRVHDRAHGTRLIGLRMCLLAFGTEGRGVRSFPAHHISILRCQCKRIAGVYWITGADAFVSPSVHVEVAQPVRICTTGFAGGPVSFEPTLDSKLNRVVSGMPG